MSIAFAHQIPESLIRGLFDSDRHSGGIPALPLENRDLAMTWLRRVLVDFEALDQHIALLQQLYGSSFQYPRPRRDRWDIEQPVDPPTNSAFSHSDRLPDDQIATVLDKGIDELSDDEIGSLLLNPFALFDLFDVIDDVQPEYWLDAIHDLVAMQSRTRRAWPPFVATKSRPEHAAVHTQHATSIDDSSKNLRHSLDSALVISKHLAEVLVREAPSRRSRGLQYAMALAATIAIVAVSWGVFQMTIAVPELRTIISQQAEIQRLTQERDVIRKEHDQIAQHPKGGVPLVETSDHQSRPVDWLLMVKEFYDPKLSDEENLKSLEMHGGDAVRDRIAELRKQSGKSSAHELLKELLHEWGGPDIR